MFTESNRVTVSRFEDLITRMVTRYYSSFHCTGQILLWQFKLNLFSGHSLLNEWICFICQPVLVCPRFLLSTCIITDSPKASPRQSVIIHRERGSLGDVITGLQIQWIYRRCYCYVRTFYQTRLCKQNLKFISNR